MALATAYDFEFKSLITGETFSFADFKGKVILVVNTASKCGFTPQYEGLQKLYDTYKDQGLVIVGVPSNDFGKQEPGTLKEIAHFCKIHYGVTFPMTEREKVLGKDAHPFYLWARSQFGCWAKPRWNFHKYLIDRQGISINYFYATTSPKSFWFKRAIKKALNQK